MKRIDAAALVDSAELLGSGLMAEVPGPTFAIRSNELLAVAGSFGSTHWSGRSLRIPNYRVGVYELDGYSCKALHSTRWPVTAMAFDPTNSVLAIGLGTYDGGYMFEGELVLLDLRDGSKRSMMSSSRIVVSVDWTASGLSVRLGPENSEDEPMIYAYHLSDEKCRGDSGSFDPAENILSVEPVEGEFIGRAAQDTQQLDALGVEQSGRRQVWDLLLEEDGAVLATLWNVRLEYWETSGQRRYSIPCEGWGCQLERVGGNVVSNISTFGNMQEDHFRDYDHSASHVKVLNPVDGSSVFELPKTRTVLLVGGDGQGFATRDISTRRESVGLTTLFDDNCIATETTELSKYGVFGHYFRIRSSPQMLVLSGSGPDHSDGPWVASLSSFDPTGGGPKFLYPLESERATGRSMGGGPGVYLEDRIIHGSHMFVDRRLTHHVVCRSAPTGEVEWNRELDHEVAALARSGEVLFVGTSEGDLLVLEVGTGEVVDRCVITVNGMPDHPMSMVANQDWLAVGLATGRILRIAL